MKACKIPMPSPIRHNTKVGSVTVIACIPSSRMCNAEVTSLRRLPPFWSLWSWTQWWLFWGGFAVFIQKPHSRITCISSSQNHHFILSFLQWYETFLCGTWRSHELCHLLPYSSHELHFAHHSHRRHSVPASLDPMNNKTRVCLSCLSYITMLNADSKAFW